MQMSIQCWMLGEVGEQTIRWCLARGVGVLQHSPCA
jgi:hypothetical protein